MVMSRRTKSSILAVAIAMIAATSAAAGPAVETGEPVAAAPVAVQQVNTSLPAIRDEAAMLLVGTALIGLAAAVRRAA